MAQGRGAPLILNQAILSHGSIHSKAKTAAASSSSTPSPAASASGKGKRKKIVEEEEAEESEAAWDASSSGAAVNGFEREVERLRFWLVIHSHVHNVN